jgi:hypothetical protein
LHEDAQYPEKTAFTFHGKSAKTRNLYHFMMIIIRRRTRGGLLLPWCGHVNIRALHVNIVSFEL